MRKYHFENIMLSIKLYTCLCNLKIFKKIFKSTLTQLLRDIDRFLTLKRIILFATINFPFLHRQTLLSAIMRLAFALARYRWIYWPLEIPRPYKM